VRVASPYGVAAGLLIAGFFTARAWTGVPSGRNYERGRIEDRAGRFAESALLLDRAAVGANRTDALWRAGRSRLALWDTMPVPDRVGPTGDRTLKETAVRFLAGLTGSPSSGWFVAALGDVYSRREIVARSRRVTELSALDRGPWALVGDDGKIAIGLTRTAIDREPNRFELRDQMVLLLEQNGLRADALRAMDESARVLPNFDAHPQFSVDSLPRELVERFWRAARSAPSGDAPLLSRDRYLLSLGQLGRRLGHLEEAEQDLRTALSQPGTSLARAEQSFHLALVLIDRGRLEEAEAMLELAAREPVFGPGVAGTRARIAEMRGRLPEALDQLREARRLQPRELWALLEFARVGQKAGSWDQAEESLRWALVVHPEDPAPRRAMVELLLAEGERARARRELEEYVRSFGRTEDAVRLEQALAEPLDRGSR